MYFGHFLAGIVQRDLVNVFPAPSGRLLLQIRVRRNAGSFPIHAQDPFRVPAGFFLPETLFFFLTARQRFLFFLQRFLSANLCLFPSLFAALPPKLRVGSGALIDPLP